MHKAIEYEVKFGKDWRPPTERRWSMGSTLIWGIVALVLGLAGKALVRKRLVNHRGGAWRAQGWPSEFQA